MTDQEINIAIAEACGWEKIYKGPEPDNRWISPNKEYRTSRDIPSYTTDLNAMHEAEKSMPIPYQGAYWFTLAEIVSGFPWNEFDCKNEYSCRDVACASAYDRAEAFLRILGKWREK